MLRSLAPELIVTQALCAVCAVSYDDVRAIAERMDPAPEVISLDPNTLGEVLGDVRTLGGATGAKDAGVDLIAGRGGADRSRAARGARRAAGLRRRARVARPGLRRRALDAAADRVRRRDRPLRPARRALRDAHVGGDRGGAAGRRRLHAVRLRRRARARGGRDLRRRARRAGRAARRGGRRLRLLLAPGPAAGRRARADGPHPPPRPGARGARRGARAVPSDADGRRRLDAAPDRAAVPPPDARPADALDGAGAAARGDPARRHAARRWTQAASTAA